MSSYRQVKHNKPSCR